MNVWVREFQLRRGGLVLNIFLASCRHFAVGNSSSGEVSPERLAYLVLEQTDSEKPWLTYILLMRSARGLISCGFVGCGCGMRRTFDSLEIYCGGVILYEGDCCFSRRCWMWMS